MRVQGAVMRAKLPVDRTPATASCILHGVFSSSAALRYRYELAVVLLNPRVELGSRHGQGCPARAGKRKPDALRAGFRACRSSRLWFRSLSSVPGGVRAAGLTNKGSSYAGGHTLLVSLIRASVMPPWLAETVRVIVLVVTVPTKKMKPTCGDSPGAQGPRPRRGRVEPARPPPRGAIAGRF
jgi:hypothetical protein